MKNPFFQTLHFSHNKKSLVILKTLFISLKTFNLHYLSK